MQRYFVSQEQISDHQITINGEDARHIQRVMRMKKGDSLIICDSSANTYHCKIQALEGQAVLCEIDENVAEQTELPIRVTLAQGLPKGDKLDWIVQKATELGVTAFIPFASERAIVKWGEPQKVQKKLERLRKIAKEAAEQSHRNTLPHIEAPLDLLGLMNLGDSFTHKLVAFEEEAKRGERHGFADLIHAMKPGDSLLVVVGPEGGLSVEEVKALESQGYSKVGLGPRILRTETAPLYILSALSYQFELSMR